MLAALRRLGLALHLVWETNVPRVAQAPSADIAATVNAVQQIALAIIVATHASEKNAHSSVRVTNVAEYVKETIVHMNAMVGLVAILAKGQNVLRAAKAGSVGGFAKECDVPRSAEAVRIYREKMLVIPSMVAGRAAREKSVQPVAQAINVDKDAQDHHARSCVMGWSVDNDASDLTVQQVAKARCVGTIKKRDRIVPSLGLNLAQPGLPQTQTVHCSGQKPVDT